MNTHDRDEARVLSILEAIHSQSDVSQRHLSDRLGVALGLTNLYLKRCVRKGLIKIKQAPANRYLYYLTPKGFAEKSRLTGLYLSISFDFYRRAGDSCSEAFRSFVERGARQILLCGASELAEIASLRAEEHGVRIVGTYDPACLRDRFVGRPLWNQFEDVAGFDGALLTTLVDSQSLYRALASKMPPKKLLVPSVLGFETTSQFPSDDNPRHTARSVVSD